MGSNLIVVCVVFLVLEEHYMQKYLEGVGDSDLEVDSDLGFGLDFD